MASPRRRKGPVESGVARDLRDLPDEVRTSAKAAAALVLAQALDAGAGLSTAAIARELRAHMSELLAAREAQEERDPLSAIRDDLAPVRQRRASGS
jgi:hypothetical protein